MQSPLFNFYVSSAAMAKDPSDLKEVGNRMRLLAPALGYVYQQDLADELNFSKSRWSNYVNGRQRPPFWVKDALRRKFSIDPSWIDYGTRDGMPSRLLAAIDTASDSPQTDSKPRRGAKRA